MSELSKLHLCSYHRIPVSCDVCGTSSADILDTDDDPQIMIMPPSGNAKLREDHLGVKGEHATPEGVLQIGGPRASAYQKLYVHFSAPSVRRWLIGRHTKPGDLASLHAAYTSFGRRE